MKTVTVYGSLKKGKYNHYLLENSKFVADTKVRGTLYMVSSYPALRQEGDKEYDAETYEVDEETYRRISTMEIGAGYVPIETKDGVVFYAGQRLDLLCRNVLQEIDSY